MTAERTLLQGEAGALLSDGELIVLASGGIDSSTILALAVSEGSSANALFVDYGQRAAVAEEEAVKYICHNLSVPLQVVRYEGQSVGIGEIRGRNGFLLQVALLESKVSAGVIAIGVHSGTSYSDCSPEYIGLAQKSFEIQTGGAIGLSAPFLNWQKSEIALLSKSLGLPIMQTYSCETGNQPCGTCNSCMDRKLLGIEG